MLTGCPLKTRLGLTAVAVAFSIVADGALLTAQAASDPSILACSPDRVLVEPGATVTIRVTRFDSGKILPADSYTTTATAGDTRRLGALLEWRLPAEPERDVETITVSAAVSAETITCSVSVRIVLPDVKGEPLRATRYLLGPEESEHPRYGLYSYLLLAEEPRSEDREIYVALIESYLRLTTEVGEYERLKEKVETTRRSIMYAPVTQLPDGATDLGAGRRISEFVLSHYHYARARELLARAGWSGAGPVLLSVPVPLTSAVPGPGLTLVEDLSAMPPRLWGHALRQMLVQASQDGHWDEGGMTRIGWKVRVAIAVVGDQVGEAFTVFLQAVRTF